MNCSANNHSRSFPERQEEEVENWVGLHRLLGWSRTEAKPPPSTQCVSRPDAQSHIAGRAVSDESVSGVWCPRVTRSSKNVRPVRLRKQLLEEHGVEIILRVKPNPTLSKQLFEETHQAQMSLSCGWFLSSLPVEGSLVSSLLFLI